jgi:hypothetical protein
MLACPACRRLVHATRLATLAADLPPQGDARAFRTMAGLVVVLSAIAWVAGHAS